MDFGPDPLGGLLRSEPPSSAVHNIVRDLEHVRLVFFFTQNRPYSLWMVQSVLYPRSAYIRVTVCIAQCRLEISLFRYVTYTKWSIQRKREINSFRYCRVSAIARRENFAWHRKRCSVQLMP